MDNRTDRQTTPHTIIIKQIATPSNGLGLAGFVLSLVALFLGWMPLFRLGHLASRIAFFIHWSVQNAKRIRYGRIYHFSD
jgi:hypothetical protein